MAWPWVVMLAVDSSFIKVSMAILIWLVFCKRYVCVRELLCKRCSLWCERANALQEMCVCACRCLQPSEGNTDDSAKWFRPLGCDTDDSAR